MSKHRQLHISGSVLAVYLTLQLDASRSGSSKTQRMPSLQQGMAGHKQSREQQHGTSRLSAWQHLSKVQGQHGQKMPSCST